MKKRVISAVVAVTLCAIQALTQVGAWKNYTSMQDVRAMTRNGNTLWAVTSGGLFSWKEGSEEYTKYTNADGLQSTNLTAVAIDRNGDVWSGAATGIIHVYTPSTNTWRFVPDIANSNQTNKQINSLIVYGDTLLISSGFGLSVFRIKQFQFGDTYTKFGSLANVRVSVSSAAIHDGKIWAAISGGPATNRIASASLSNPNLLPAEAWTLSTAGTEATITRQLAAFNSRLYASTTNGLFFYEGASWTPVAAFSGRGIAGLASSATKLIVAGADRNIDTLSAQNVAGRIAAAIPADPTSAIVGANGGVIIGARDIGIVTLTNNNWVSHFPNGPATNQVLSIAADLDGNVWAASGADGNGKGFFRLDAQSKLWKNFNRANSKLPTNDFYRASAACNGDVWLGAWGPSGAIVLMPRGATTVDTAKVYGRNVGISSISGFPTYFVIGQAICDKRSNTWITVMIPEDKHSLAIRKADGTWTTLSAYIGGVPHSYLTGPQVSRSLAVDASNNIWTTAVTSAPLGVACFNNRGSLTDSVAEVLLTTADGLPSNAVTSIVTDNDNDIWIGTERGIAIVLDPDNPKKAGGIASYKPLTGTTINAIAVDPLNQKWVATNEGAILLSRDGTQTLAQYNVANTSGKLIHNEIRDIAIDSKSGTVYFATAGGLASLTTTAAQPKEAFDELIISPNPYRIPSSVPLLIDGLIENSSIKIISIDGHLVRDLQSPGGRIGFWDGKDDNGKDVASGVYLVIAYSDADKSKVGKGKVAVLRK